jgi:hypothetical protein
MKMVSVINEICCFLLSKHVTWAFGDLSYLLGIALCKTLYHRLIFFCCKDCDSAVQGSILGLASRRLISRSENLAIILILYKGGGVFFGFFIIMLLPLLNFSIDYLKATCVCRNGFVICWRERVVFLRESVSASALPGS